MFKNSVKPHLCISSLHCNSQTMIDFEEVRRLFLEDKVLKVTFLFSVFILFTNLPSCLFFLQAASLLDSLKSTFGRAEETLYTSDAVSRYIHIPLSLLLSLSFCTSHTLSLLLSLSFCTSHTHTLSLFVLPSPSLLNLCSNSDKTDSLLRSIQQALEENKDLIQRVRIFTCLFLPFLVPPSFLSPDSSSRYNTSLLISVIYRLKKRD